MQKILIAALLLVCSTARAGIILEGAADSLELVTASAGSIDYHCDWGNVTATALTTPGTTKGNITTATTTTVIAAPSAGNFRHIRSCIFRNASTTASNALTVQRDVSATNRVMFSATLAPGETAQINELGDWRILNTVGTPRFNVDTPGFTGLTLHWTKVATAIDTIGYHYLANKDSGFPGAWSVGTPGVNGVATACDVVGTAGTGGALSTGSHVLADPASGGWYLTRFGTNAVVSNTYQLVDIVWYNTGLAVAAGAQAITTPTLPARDLNGSTNGEGYRVAVYALTALGNAAAVATSTVTYTNSAGTAGRTATFSGAVGFQSPATPVIGTWMPFMLQAGDTGIRAISSFNTGTTYTSGTMMLVIYRPLSLDGVATANFPSGSLVSRAQLNPGVRIYNDTCFAVGVIGGIATTAPSFTAGVVELMAR